jgi:tyrosyl-tRNA synthetase
MPSLSEDLRFRGLVHQVSDPALLPMLDRGGVCAYIGFDPTADSLHIGNLLQLCNLRRLQLAGNRPIVLAGGATGMIGDPGGKSEERPLLDREQIAHNLVGIRAQLERFLDFSPEAGPARAALRDNGDWLLNYPLIEFLRDVGKHFTVNQMVAKEMVRTRFEQAEESISYTEFSYMLLQAADFLHLFDTEGCRLQMGASDQWGNITMGIELIRKRRNESAYALTSPLVTKADGTKFGKSESGALYLSPERTSPWALYQYLLRTEDEMVGSYLRFFTFLTHEELEDLDRQIAEEPGRRAAQQRLAAEVTTLVHGADWTVRVQRAAAALYSEDLHALEEESLVMALEDAPSTRLGREQLAEGLAVVDLLASVRLVTSKSQARTTIAQGGAYVNNVRVDDESRTIGSGDLLCDRYVVLRRGRREMHLLEFA